MSKYLKVMFDNKGVNFEYKINEINSADISYDELLFQTEIEGILN